MAANNKKTTVKEEKPEMLYIEALGMRGSGWIQDGTENTANPIELAWPEKFGIPVTGKRKVFKEDGGWYLEDIRHIKSCPIIGVPEQKQKGIEPSPMPWEDALTLDKGFGIFVREGEMTGTFDYIKEATYNVSNPDRVATATGLYRVIKMEKKNEADIENEMVQADAIKFVGTLYEKKGKSYVYNEQAIDAVCSLLSIFAETYSGRVIAIQQAAKQNPSWFLDKVVKFQQTTLTEVLHALELNVIEFSGNNVQYKTKDKLIVSLGSDKLSRDQKIENFGNWLRTSDGHEDYMELKAEIEMAKEKELTN